MRLFIITGASKGLGKAMAEIVEANGDQSVDISRNSTNFKCDLSQVESIDACMEEIFKSKNVDQFSELVLVNNAGMIEPVAPLGKLEASAVDKLFKVNLVAPMVLTNAFIRLSSDYKGALKVVNISSGVATRPIASWAAYSASKAGLENFSACLQMEQEGRLQSFCINPGLIDTGMQKTIRESDSSHFPQVDRFKDFHSGGNLVAPTDVATRVLKECDLV